MMNRFSTLVAIGTALAAAAVAWQQQTAAKLPAPYATPSVANPAKVVSRPADAQLKLPAGFKAEQIAGGFKKARYMAEGPGGEIVISDAVPNGTVYVFTQKDPGQKKALIENLDRPYGLAFWKGYLYVTEAQSIKRYKYDSKAMTAGPGEEVIPLKGYDKGHWTRTIAFSPKGDKMYVSIGSSANLVTGDPENRAAVNRYNPDGSGAEVFATGLRNPVGLRFYPGTDNVWVTVQERDGLGDDLVPDYFTQVRQKGFYGWPYAYSGKYVEPRIEEKDRRPNLVDSAITPDVLLAPHCAVLDFLFYSGKQFPAEYQGGAFLANHGSGNRSKRLGYSVTFVPFQNGRPSGPPRDFLTGYMMGEDEKNVWGRPVALVQLRDGSMLLSEDGNNTVWKISYQR